MNEKQILAVEDEHIMAEDIKMSLERLGYSIYGIAVCVEEPNPLKPWLPNIKIDSLAIYHLTR